MDLNMTKEQALRGPDLKEKIFEDIMERIMLSKSIPAKKYITISKEDFGQNFREKLQDFSKNNDINMNKNLKCFIDAANIKYDATSQDSYYINLSNFLSIHFIGITLVIGTIFKTISYSAGTKFFSYTEDNKHALPAAGATGIAGLLSLIPLTKAYNYNSEFSAYQNASFECYNAIPEFMGALPNGEYYLSTLLSID